MAARDEPVPQPHYGAVLRRLRRAAGLTQEEFAERAGVSPRTVSDLERGVSAVPQRQTRKLLEGALALSPEDAAALEAAASSSRRGPAPERLGQSASDGDA